MFEASRAAGALLVEPRGGHGEALSSVAIPAPLVLPKAKVHAALAICTYHVSRCCQKQDACHTQGFGGVLAIRTVVDCTSGAVLLQSLVGQQPVTHLSGQHVSMSPAVTAKVRLPVSCPGFVTHVPQGLTPVAHASGHLAPWKPPRPCADGQTEHQHCRRSHRACGQAA